MKDCKLKGGELDHRDLTKVVRSTFYSNIPKKKLSDRDNYFRNSIEIKPLRKSYFDIYGNKQDGEMNNFNVEIFLDNDGKICIGGSLPEESLEGPYARTALMGVIAHELGHYDCGHHNDDAPEYFVQYHDENGKRKTKDLEKAIELQADIRTIRRGAGM